MYFLVELGGADCTLVKCKKDVMIVVSGLKLYNTAADKTNFTVTLHVENVSCDRSSLVVYGDQVGTEDSSSRFMISTRHFTGGFTILKSIPTTSANQCKYGYTSQGSLYYIFIKLFASETGTKSKLCEVTFENW